MPAFKPGLADLPSPVCSTAYNLIMSGYESIYERNTHFPEAARNCTLSCSALCAR